MKIPICSHFTGAPEHFIKKQPRRGTLSLTFTSMLLTVFLFAAVCFSQAQNTDNTIKIGLLVRDREDLGIVRAAQLAIAEADTDGKYRGKPAELIIKYCDGPWGITSKQVTELIYEEDVSLIVDALDGRNAHLAEQVTAKSQIVLLSALSSDPTLSRAYVPWYFRMVPDDRRQSEALIREIYDRNKFRDVVIVTLDDYDGKKSAEAFTGVLTKKGDQKAKVLSGLSENELISQIRQHPAEVVVLSGTATNTHLLVEKLLGIKPGLKIYGFLNVLNFMTDYRADISEKVTFPYLPDIKTQKMQAFNKAFQNGGGKVPNPVLAYVYDGILLSAAAIRQFGPDSDTLRNNFNSVKFSGITGEVSFDKLGDRITSID